MRRCVLQQLRDEVDGAGIGLPENLRLVSYLPSHTEASGGYLIKGMRLDLRELVLHVIGVHGANLIPCRCSQDLDDLDKLVDARLAGKQRLSEHEFGHDTAGRPNIYEPVLATYRRMQGEERTDFGGVIGRSKDELGGSVVPGADVRDVGLVLHQNLCATEIAQLEYARSGVQQQVLRLDVSVADPLRVDVGEGAEKLVDVELDLEDGHHRLHLVEITRRTVYGLGHKLKHQVEVDFVFLWLVSRQ